MSMIKLLSFVFLSIVLLSSCVSTRKYEDSLHNVSALENEKTGLEEKLTETEERLENEKAARTALESDLAKQKQVNEELTRVQASLFDVNKEMNATIAELSREKLQAMKAKDQAMKEKDKAISELQKTYNNLVSELNEEIKKGEIEVTQLKDKLTLSMVEKILFDSGRADIKENGKAVLHRVAEILKNISDKQIRIEGHTDNVPIGPVLAVKFPTNWELSTARSTTVVRYLQDQGVDPAFLSAAGYSEYRPVDFSDTVEGRAKNRRIEIVLIPLDIAYGVMGPQ